MAAIPSNTKTWILNEKPGEQVNDKTFKLETKPIRELKDGEILVKVLYFSNDPAQRTWISKDVVKDRAYGPCPNEGDAMPSGILARVVKTKSSQWKEGDLVNGFASWSEYAVVNEKAVMAARQIEGHSESIALSGLGMTTLTAYCGLYEVGQIKPEHTVVISGAAGATGSAAVQIAKHIVGCKKVIAIAGGSAKCDWVKSLGADVCLDYKSDSFADDLVKATQDGYVDVYFDNVSGKILDLVLARMARWSRVIACGAISGYEGERGMHMKNLFEIISMRITMQGFIVSDFMDKWPAAVDVLKKAIQEKKFTTEGTETKVEASFEEVPKVWARLFTGQNQGKLITQLKA
ncbi:quinone oxidoreductase [Rhodotorula kratochvilovae]